MGQGCFYGFHLFNNGFLGNKYCILYKHYVMLKLYYFFVCNRLVVVLFLKYKKSM